MNAELIRTISLRILQATASLLFGYGILKMLALPHAQGVIVFAFAVGIIVSLLGFAGETVMGAEKRSLAKTVPLCLIGSAIGIISMSAAGVPFTLEGMLIPVIGAVAAYHFAH